MGCFDFSSDDPEYLDSFNGVASIEVSYANTGVGPYSFSSISRLCDIPASDQICVYVDDGVTETQLTYAIDYSISGENVTLINAVSQATIIIRRCTPNTKMFSTFVEGAKLTAKQLNLVLSQLLFISQEKTFVPSTQNHYYPLSAKVTPWNVSITYAANQYVNYNGSIYQSKISGNVGNQPDSNPTEWDFIEFATNGFIISGSPLSYPVEFDLSGVQLNQGLVWNGTKFTAGFIEGPSLDNLSDVIITSANTGDLLRYNGSNWVNFTPPFIMLSNDFEFNVWAYYKNQASLNQAKNDSAITLNADKWNPFKDTERWVIPNIPTVYGVIKNTLPSSEQPPGSENTAVEDFFTRVLNAVNLVETNTGNPIKAQLYWNLNLRRYPAWEDTDSGEPLDSFRTVFWDKPLELYNVDMWSNPKSLQYSGTNLGKSTGELYEREALQNAYWAELYTGENTITFQSKLYGYNIEDKGFYLSVPECYTTSLSNLPIINEITDNYYALSDIITPEIIQTNLNDNEGIDRDNYLAQLRDFAFAGFRADNTGSGTNKGRDKTARTFKNKMLAANYNGFNNVSFKRLETEEDATDVLWKMPAQIIYFNKYALAFANNSTATFGIENAFVNLMKGTRFTGRHVAEQESTLGTSTIQYATGGIYKSDKVWSAWCSRWSDDAPDNISFNEADIEWMVYNCPNTTNNFGDFFANKFLKTNPATTGPNPPRSGTIYPWLYRPNNFLKEGNVPNGERQLNGSLGTHLFNLDYNKLFSEAHNFVSDPRDEYVFRVVLKPTLTAVFRNPAHNSATPQTAVIVDYGFSEETDLTTANKTTLSEIFKKNKSNINASFRKAKFNKENVFIYVQNEHFEEQNGIARYVLTLCISVPRLKSIGYSRIFRRAFQSTPTSTYVPAAQDNTEDTDKDLGPWTFELKVPIWNDPRTDSNNLGLSGYDHLYSNAGPTNEWTAVGKPQLVAGRNECAVKFSRMGIPSNLWIKLSILNSDGTSTLLNSNGWIVP